MNISLSPRARTAFALASIIVLSIAGIAPASDRHVEWTQVNQADPDMIGLYHFDEHHADLFVNEEGLASGYDLAVGAAAGDPFAFEHSDHPGAIFAPHAIHFQSAQRAESSAEAHGVDGDLTVEFWFQWDPAMTTQRIEVGLAKGAKLTIARDQSDHANDLFGVATVHGDFRSAPGFPDWAAVGAEEASLGEWRHMAMTVHSTGFEFDDMLGHDVYAAGSTARFYLNGHLTGTAETTVDLAGMRAHDHSALVIDNKDGLFFIDEVVVWTIDWSEDGANAFPFGEGRGSGAPPATPWTETNGVGPDTLGHYQFDAHHADLFEATDGLPMEMDLAVGAPAGDAFGFEHSNWPDPIFAPHAIRFRSAQLAESSGAVEAAGDSTVEYWLFWDDTLAEASEFRAGFKMGAKLHVLRDPAAPANDRLGMSYVHGDFVPAPGFTDWGSLGMEAPLGAWLHLAVTIHSTGVEFDDMLGHDVYTAGSTARFWLNGEELGGGTRAAVDIAGVRVHDHSPLVIENIQGGIVVDEVTMWGRDWSDDGATGDAFLNGRTSGPAAVADWMAYE